MLSNEVPQRLIDLDCPDLGSPAAATGPAMSQRRVAIISTAGLAHIGDRPFSLGGSDYRIIDTDDVRPLVMSHISTNFDRSGFAADANVVFPLARLQERAAQGQIGSVARFHYSFMGATDPERMRPAAEQLATLLAADQVDLALLVPV